MGRKLGDSWLEEKKEEKTQLLLLLLPRSRSSPAVMVWCVLGFFLPRASRSMSLKVFLVAVMTLLKIAIKFPKSNTHVKYGRSLLNF